jgi:heme exporter protein A
MGRIFTEHVNDNGSGYFIIKGAGLSKRFGYRTIFKNTGFEFSAPVSAAITGSNGSGKSTLLKIMAGIISPTSGSVEYYSGGVSLPRDERFTHIGYLGPDVNPYDELTARENILFASSPGTDSGRCDYLLEKLGIIKFRGSQVKVFSSGMRQRLKFILAVINDPPVLFFDEPGMNLDSSGKEAVYSMISFLSEKKIVVIAANEKTEIELCSARIDLFEK